MTNIYENLNPGEKKFVKYFVLAFITVITLFVAGQVLSTFGLIKDRTPYGPNTITVVGTADVYAAADIASFSYSVTEESAKVADAQKAATEIGNKTLAFLSKSGIAEKDVKTTDYSIYPQYDYVQSACVNGYCGGKQVLRAYQVSQSVTVKVRDISKVGDILAGIGTLGVKNISSLQFSVDDKKVLENQARDIAIADAKTQAEKLASKLGVRLGKIIGFSDNSSGGYPMPMYEMGMSAKSAVADVAPELPQGQNKFTGSVSVTYEIK